MDGTVYVLYAAGVYLRIDESLEHVQYRSTHYGIPKKKV
jgi:hypothetical protein